MDTASIYGRALAKIAALKARADAGKTRVWWVQFRRACRRVDAAKARLPPPSVHGGA